MMSQLLFSLIILVSVCLGPLVQGQASTSTQQLCNDVVANLDCSLDPPRNICGDNGVTYRTSCDFAKAHCADPNIHIRYYGECAEVDKPDPICPELLASTCPTNFSPVCASDRFTYDNFCKFQKAKCKTVSLSLVSLGVCPTLTPPTTTTTASLFDLICQVILTEQCPSGQPQVCGSDGVTYNSGCELEKANCQETTNVYLVNEGPC